MSVVALSVKERKAISVLCEKEILEPRSGQDPEMLNDIAEMMVKPITPGFMEGLRDA